MPAPAASADTPAYVRTCHRLAGVEFPWDLTRSLELALLKTFCLPSISGLLQRSGEFEQRPRKRYDDTGLMVAELLRHGPQSEVGRAVIDRMNRIHGHYAIGNDDFLYVLSTFVAEPIRWLERYGWRPLTATEREHLFRFWQVVGQGMGIHGIPATLEELLAWNERLEREGFTYAASNRRIAEATLAMLLEEWPPLLRPPLRRVLTALLEKQVAGSLGWTQPPDWLQRLVLVLLRLRSRGAAVSQTLARRLGAAERSRFYSDRPTASYGGTFSLEQLGPPALLASLNRAPRRTGRDDDPSLPRPR